MTKLDELVTQINREHVYIQTHNFPDPDAIASAFGLQELLKLRGIHATICYKGKIDRYSTDKLREILDIRLVNIENIDSELTEDDEVILVDAQKGNSMRSSASTIIRFMRKRSTGLRISGRVSGLAHRS